MGATGPFDLSMLPLHLGLGATIVPQEAFTGDSEWYERYAQRTEADGVDGRLVVTFSFDEPWTMWEMHPHGAELVVCTSGRFTLIQDHDGETVGVDLSPGQAAINPPGAWHTADTDVASTALFVTAGLGTQHRAR